MPDFCVAVGCSNERNAQTKRDGITFHKFPKDKVRRKAWTVALSRKDFVPHDRSIICSRHFKPEDFDRTGQTTRLREGVIPSLPDLRVPRISRPSRTPPKAAAESPEVHVRLSEDLQQSTSDHQYALDPVKVKQRLSEAQERLEELQRELRNAKDRERRNKKTVKFLQENLKHKHMQTEKLQQKLDFHSGGRRRGRHPAKSHGSESNPVLCSKVPELVYVMQAPPVQLQIDRKKGIGRQAAKGRSESNCNDPAPVCGEAPGISL